MAIDKAGLSSWLVRAREVLNREWDPIGVLPYDGGPEDEYDQYRDRLASMISAHATDKELAAYLDWAARENMGLGTPTNANAYEEVLTRVISALRALGPPPQDTTQ